MKAILTFHSIDDSGSVLSYPPAMFRRLVRSLVESDLPVLDLDTLLEPSTNSGVSLTFDDGMKSVLAEAVPVLRDHDVAAHLFLATDHVGRSNQWSGQPADAPGFNILSWSEVEQCQAAAMRIESHSASHADLRLLGPDAADEDCARADAIIEQRLGRAPRYFAYPYGFRNEAVSERLGRRYRGCVTTQLRYLNRRDAKSELPRLDSYYLNNPQFFNLRSPRTQIYLKLRGWLRTLRGTQ